MDPKPKAIEQKNMKMNKSSLLSHALTFRNLESTWHCNKIECICNQIEGKKQQCEANEGRKNGTKMINIFSPCTTLGNLESIWHLNRIACTCYQLKGT